MIAIIVREVDQERLLGRKKINTIEDHLLLNVEHLIILKMKLKLKNLNLNAPETLSKLRLI
jgi:hypothetical protein